MEFNALESVTVKMAEHVLLLMELASADRAGKAPTAQSVLVLIGLMVKIALAFATVS